MEPMNGKRFGHVVSRLLMTAGLWGTSLVATGCGGSNVFETLAVKSEKDQVKSTLNKGDYAQAILDLEDYVARNPDDAEARSMLADARLKLIGVDAVSMASRVASSPGDWRSIVSTMPEGTPDNVTQLTLAVETLEGIPEDKRTPEQNYQLALAQASLALTLTRQVGTDADGKVNPEKVDAMSDSDADSIVAALKGTKSALSASGAGDDGKGSAKLGSLSDKIAAEPGNSDAERLRSYLKKQN